MDKHERLSRKITLLQARIASAQGKHELASNLFASVGISYHVKVVN